MGCGVGGGGGGGPQRPPGVSRAPSCPRVASGSERSCESRRGSLRWPASSQGRSQACSQTRLGHGARPGAENELLFFFFFLIDLKGGLLQAGLRLAFLLDPCSPGQPHHPCPGPGLGMAAGDVPRAPRRGASAGSRAEVCALHLMPAVEPQSGCPPWRWHCRGLAAAASRLFDGQRGCSASCDVWVLRSDFRECISAFVHLGKGAGIDSKKINKDF